MGFLDALLGGSKLPPAKVDKLFAMSTARVTLEAQLGLRAGEIAGLCIKPLASSAYEEVKSDIEGLLKISQKDTGTEYSIQKDDYNYLWVVLRDRDFDDLVAGVHMVSQTLIEQGLGTQLLCAVYRFRGESTVYWIYNFKQGSYYPFAPRGDKQRDQSLEFRLRSVMEPELPMEKDVEKWYPLWGMPL